MPAEVISSGAYAPHLQGVDGRPLNPIRSEIRRKEPDQRKHDFLSTIGRPDLASVITVHTPIAISSMECYRPDMPAQGGLGMVVGDWSQIYRKLGLPVAIVAPFYNVESHQVLDGSLYQTEVPVSVTPEERGFEKIEGLDVMLSTKFHEKVDVPVYSKQEDNVFIIAPHHPAIGDVYNGKTNSDHRLFQEIVEGFGGYQAMQQLGMEPPVYIMNEAPVVFTPLAELDALVREGADFNAALAQIKQKTVYVNHTLVQAVESPFTWDQFESFVFPNIKSPEVKDWVSSKFRFGELKLSTLALELSGKRRGVSMLHAREASRVYTDAAGNPVEFTAITNGISMERWAHPDLLDTYKEAGIVDEFELAPEGSVEKILELDAEKLKASKDKAKDEFRVALRNMKDQNGNPIDLPIGAKVIGSARRAAGYKRMGLPFKDTEKLAQILVEQDAHFFISGKAHTKDDDMKLEIQRICGLINSHPVLSQRVHYIQDYNESVSGPLIRAADLWLNYPTVRDENGKPTSTEADGTSKDKAILNNAIVVSTEDGGMMDPALIEAAGGTVVPGDHAPYYLRINSDTPDGELASFYSQLDRGLSILDGKDAEYSWGRFVKRQLASNWNIISGGRWVKEELDFAFPKNVMRLNRPVSLQVAS